MLWIHRLKHGRVYEHTGTSVEEQLTLLKKCDLGRSILRKANPSTLDEFRDEVPLTTYKDYAPYLLKRRMDVLPKSRLCGSIHQENTVNMIIDGHRNLQTTGGNRTAGNGVSAVLLV